jgi:hypothetical protein
MGKGLLAWWRRRIVARGLAGVAFFAVPVAVAALIGFGTSLSGVAGGLSAVTNGPDAAPASSQTGPAKLNRAVVALASKQTTTQAVSGGGRSATPNISGTGTTGGSGGSTGISGSSNDGSGSGSGSTPTISTPNAPQVNLPGSGSGGTTGQTIDNVQTGVNNVLGGVDNTLNGLLGK